MKTPFKSCPDCGAHLDPNEVCECKKKTASSGDTLKAETADIAKQVNAIVAPVANEVKPIDEDALCDLFGISDNLLQLSRLLVSSYFEMKPDKNGKSPDDLWFSASYEVIAATVRILNGYAFDIRNGLDAVLDRRPPKGGAA